MENRKRYIYLTIIALIAFLVVSSFIITTGERKDQSTPQDKVKQLYNGLDEGWVVIETSNNTDSSRLSGFKDSGGILTVKKENRTKEIIRAGYYMYNDKKEAKKEWKNLKSYYMNGVQDNKKEVVEEFNQNIVYYNDEVKESYIVSGYDNRYVYIYKYSGNKVKVDYIKTIFNLNR